MAQKRPWVQFAIASAEDDLEHMMSMLSFDDPPQPIKRVHTVPQVNTQTALNTYAAVMEDIRRGKVPAHLPNDTGEWMPPNEFGVALKSPFALYPHQVEATKWALERERNPTHGMRGGVASMEMGTGKTLLSLNLIMSTWEPNQCATLAIMPKTLLTNYMLDASKFFGDHINALIWERDILMDRFFLFTERTPYKNHVVIVSYDTVLACAKAASLVGRSGNKKLADVARLFFETPWYRVIMDESHKFSNHKSLLWSALKALKPGRRLCLTGTAVKNYEDELFAQFMVCGMNTLQDHREWTIQNYRIHGLREAVFALTMEECKLELPEKVEHRHNVVLSAEEKQVYSIVMKQSSSALDAFKSKQTTFASVLQMFTRLRQVCIAAHLIAPQSKVKKLTKVEAKRLEPGALLGMEHLHLEQRIRDPRGVYGIQSSKIRSLIQIAQGIPADEKMLVFAEWSGACRLAAEALRQALGDGTVEVVDGDTKDRDLVFGRFRLDPNVRFLVCTAVGTTGLTFIEANHAVSLSTMWNSVTNDQFFARIHRIGQKKLCHMWHLVVNNSIEAHMIDICNQKHDIRDILLEKGLNSDVLEAFLGGPALD